MPLSSVTINNYRSVRNLTLPAEPLTIFVGANGVGKSNLYKALALLQRCADGTVTRSIAREGGLESTLWVGPRNSTKAVRLSLKARFSDLSTSRGEENVDYSYEVEIGLKQPTEAAFALEPLVKKERLIMSRGLYDVPMMERTGPAVMLRDAEGARETLSGVVLSSETALAAFRDGNRYPELEVVRREMQGWRLYHDFRTDADSPIRNRCHAITTPTLSPDGHDLAAVLATLSSIRQDTTDIDAAIADAFPDARLHAEDMGSWCELSLHLPGMPRAFAAHELSDGTLKYLCLLGALMGYRLPPLVALNEPETSLHPSLLPALSRLIAQAARHTQVWVVTHSEALAKLLLEETGKRARRVIKTNGATGIEGLKLSGDYADDD